MKRLVRILFCAALTLGAAEVASAQSFRPANSWVNDAAFMLDRKDWAGGTQLTRQALRSGELTPENHAAALNNLCIGLTGLNQYAEATESCLKAIELSPRQWQSYNNLANIYYFLGQYDKALAQYYKALSFRTESSILLKNIRLTLDMRNRQRPGDV
jgi:tetratricopeptide (TPR) repeat protein